MLQVNCTVSALYYLFQKYSTRLFQNDTHTHVRARAHTHTCTQRQRNNKQSTQDSHPCNLSKTHEKKEVRAKNITSFQPDDQEVSETKQNSLNLLFTSCKEVSYKDTSLDLY